MSGQDASPGNTPDTTVPSSTVEHITQSQVVSDESTVTHNVAKNIKARATNAETSNTLPSTSVTPTAKGSAIEEPEDPAITRMTTNGVTRRPEEVSESPSATRTSTVSLESETVVAGSDDPPGTNQNNAETGPPVPPSTRTDEIHPSTPEALAAAPSVENIETASNESTKPKQSAVTKPRKRRAPATSGENETETDRQSKKRRAPRKKATIADADGEAQTDGVENNENVRSRARRPRKERTTAQARDSTDHLEEDNADATGSETEGIHQEGAVKRPKRRRRRSTTPENAQEMTIDRETWTIAQLTKNLRMGKRWDRYKDVETAERNRKRELQKQRLIKLGLLQEGEELPADDVSESGTPAPESTPPAKDPTPPPPPPPPPTAGGISMRIDANGNIIVDESSLQHDRHREADMHRGTLQVQEENEFSKRVTQQTYMRRQPQANFWTADDTEKFYRGLRMFGTDFNMISKLFGGAKSRRQVKLKFNREERAHPMEVNQCLIGEKVVPMDLEEIDGADGLEDSQVINDELARLREEREAEARRVEDEIAAEARRKKEELFGKKKGKNHLLQDHDDNNKEGDINGDDSAAVEETTNGRASTNRQRSERSQQQQQEHPAAKYGVGTDPDVIDETDLPTASSSTGRVGGGGRGTRGGKGGRRGGKAVFASGFGV